MKKSLLLLMALMVSALAAPLFAAVKTEKVEYKIGEVVLEGFLAYDDASTEKRPGVLIVHQWLGITEHEENVARKLAEAGYVAFAADIYGKGTRPSGPSEAGVFAGKYRGGDRKELRARAKAGLDTLKAHALVDASRTAVIGYCFGGTAALEVARSGADIKAAVSFHGGLSAVNADDAKNIKCKVLAHHGADDPYVPEAEVLAFQKEMRDAKVDWYLVAYGNAVHSFTDLKANSDAARYNKEADMRSWASTMDLFKEVFAK